MHADRTKPLRPQNVLKRLQRHSAPDVHVQNVQIGIGCRQSRLAPYSSGPRTKEDPGFTEHMVLSIVSAYCKSLLKEVDGPLTVLRCGGARGSPLRPQHGHSLFQAGSGCDVSWTFGNGCSEPVSGRTPLAYLLS